ncbi:MAG: hydroxyacid-oxoacid transhydrogenase [bacterium]
MREIWRFCTAPEVIFGFGAVSKVGRVAKRLGAQRALVVTDANLVRLGHLDKVLSPLRDEGIEADVFDGGRSEPPAEVLESCAKFAREKNPDLIIGLGGGSNLDLSKGTATLLTHGGKVGDYFGEAKLPGPITPLIAVSTTSGTGSAVSAVAVFTDTKTNRKMGISDNHQRPLVAIYDPLLAATMPREVTASSGIDALCHALEALTALDYAYLDVEADVAIYQGRNTLTEWLALKAIELIGENLRLAVDQGQNLEARKNMALATLFSGMSFSNAGVAAVHAISHPVGAITHAPHGVVNGLLLPYVMEYNLPVRAKELALAAKLLGEKTEGLSEVDAARKAVDAIRSLQRDIGLPQRLGEIGVKEEHIDVIVRETMEVERLIRGNPRRIGLEDIKRIVRGAL